MISVLVVVEQDAAGCDYTLGCGISVNVFKFKSDVDLEYQILSKKFSDEYYRDGQSMKEASLEEIDFLIEQIEYHRVKSVKIVKLENVLEVDFGEIVSTMKENLKEGEQAKHEAEQEMADMKKLEELRKKYPEQFN